jgi:hypothetical protein
MFFMVLLRRASLQYAMVRFVRAIVRVVRGGCFGGWHGGESDYCIGTSSAAPSILTPERDTHEIHIKIDRGFIHQVNEILSSMRGLVTFFGTKEAEEKEMVDGIFGIRTGAGKLRVIPIQSPPLPLPAHQFTLPSKFPFQLLA